MPFPFSIEDRIEVRLDAPEKASRVAEGIREWLLKQGAHELRWDGPCLGFKGPPYRRQQGLLRPRNALRGVGESKMQFHPLPEKVVIEYSISFEPLGIRLVPFCILVIIGACGMPDPRLLLLLPVACLVVAALAYVIWFANRQSSKAYFEVAAIRGLADGAEREYEALRSQ